jgi:hypothetical protein
LAESLYVRDFALGTVEVHGEGEATMTGTTAGNPLHGSTDELRIGLRDATPEAAEVEAELRRIARDRLAPTIEGDRASSSHRISRSLLRRHQPLGGAFDSPEGFAFTSR